MKQLLLVSERGRWNLGSSIRRAFEDEGWDVKTLDWGPWSPRWLSSAAFRYPALGASLRRALLRQLAQLPDHKTDLVIVMKGHLLNASCIRTMRRRTGAPIVCWNADSPFDPAIANSGGGIPSLVSVYDAYVTWSAEVAERLRLRQPQVAVIPFGVDPHIHYPEPGTGEYKDRLVFVGTFTPQRAELLERLRAWNPVVFGNDWPALPGVQCRPEVTGSALRQALGEAKWSLNLLRTQNRTSHNMRTFEVPACGGRQLAPRTGDHEVFLKGTGAVLFDSEGELLAALESEPPVRAVLARSWLGEHTYRRRVQQLVDFLGMG